MNIPLKVYREAVDRGWSVVPWMLETVNGQVSKRPVVKWKEYQTRLPTLDEMKGWADKYNAIALVTGELSKVVVVDIDEVNQDKYPYLISPVRVKSAFSGGRHYYYKYDDRLASFGPQAKIEGLPMDYRGEGGVIILPPSNLGDFSYQWDAFEPEILDHIPDEVFQKLKNPEKKFEKGELVSFDDLHSTGDRNQSATQIAGKMLEGTKQELWEVLCWVSLQHWNDHYCNPPLETRELRTIFESIAGKELRNRAEELIWHEQEVGFTETLKNELGKEKKMPFMSGYTQLDAAVGGFHYANAYLVAGLDKSGKSSWMMKVIQTQLEAGMLVGYVNTELPQPEFVRRMAAYWKNIIFDAVTDADMIAWSEKFSKHLKYLGVETMPTQEKMLKTVEGFTRDGISCLVFDNITSWGNKLNADAESWQVTADLADSLIQMTKRAGIITFMVRHLNPNIVDNSSITTFKKIMDSKEYWKIFNDQISIVKKPTTANVYGGGQIVSQVSGTILIWRPYQKFTEDAMSRRTALMVEAFRHAQNAMIPAEFIGDKGLFVEQESFSDVDAFMAAVSTKDEDT